MSLVVNSNVAAMNAHQNLEAHMARADDGSIAAVAATRAAESTPGSDDSVRISYARSASEQPTAVLGADRAQLAAALLASQITSHPAAAVQAQGNSMADKVFALVQ